MHSWTGSLLYAMYIFHVIFSYLWLSKVLVNERRCYIRDVTESLFSQRPGCVDLHGFYMMPNSFIFRIFGACHTCTITLIRSKCFIVTVSCQRGLWWCVQVFYNYNQSKLINQGLDSMNNATVSSWKHKHSSYKLSCWIFRKVIKCASTFSVISQHLASAGICNRHFCTTRARLVCIVNFLVAGGLDTQGFGASGTMIWT